VNEERHRRLPRARGRKRGGGLDIEVMVILDRQVPHPAIVLLRRGAALEAGTGPIVNPFPLARPGRAHAHHNPMDPFPKQKSGLFRPRVPQRVPRQIPDAVFNELFARLPSNRDRALVAFWVSTGARASELLTATWSGADPGQQLITVIRKGSRAIQQLPASPDAFVWLRLYQQEMHGLAPVGPDCALWRTLRRPYRPLNYHAAQAIFNRANAAVGAGWTLHSLRHTYRLAREGRGVAPDATFRNLHEDGAVRDAGASAPMAIRGA
jgi:integrase